MALSQTFDVARTRALDRAKLIEFPVPLQEFPPPERLLRDATPQVAPALHPKARTIAVPRGIVRGGVRAVVVLLALAGPLLAFAGEKSVTVDVEGRVRHVRTYA